MSTPELFDDIAQGGVSERRNTIAALGQARHHAVPVPDDIEIHPAANLFPMMDEPALADLAERIARNGQTDACMLFEGKLLDGRNRYAACRLKGITPRYQVWDGTAYGWDPYRYVEDVNLGRRQLTPVQRAAVAAAFVKVYEEQARQRQADAGVHGAKGGRGKTLGDGSSPRVRDQKGRAVVQSAKRHGAGIGATQALVGVQERAPEVATLARNNLVNVQQAKDVAALPAPTRQAVVAQIEAGNSARKVLDEVKNKPPATRRGGKGLEDRIADLRAAVRSRLMRCPAADRGPLLDALQAVVIEERTALGAAMLSPGARRSSKASAQATGGTP